MSITRVNDFDGVARNGAGLSDACVVDENVWHTVPFGDVVGMRVHRGLIGHVELIGVRGAARFLDHHRGFFRGDEIDIGKDDLGAAPRKGERRFASDAASAAGDHHQLAVEGCRVLRHFTSFMVVGRGRGFESALARRGDIDVAALSPRSALRGPGHHCSRVSVTGREALPRPRRHGVRTVPWCRGAARVRTPAP